MQGLGLLRRCHKTGWRFQDSIISAKRRVSRSAGYATATAFPAISNGDLVHGFLLKRTTSIDELKLNAYLLEHVKTGADYLHIEREDTNNVFSIGFKTNPPDHTGVPHILEHTTLCGSHKFPVRDPFFKMLRRSLSNFMNAFTAADHTTYPFATTNTQDFENLRGVYLDATLAPLLRHDDFLQEGWRIGPRGDTSSGEVDDKQKGVPMEFKGVVYNEMKGQMSDAGYYFLTKFQDFVFPEINNSGGDPGHIVDLSYDQLRAFHSENYHPSNTKIMTYGSIPLEKHAWELDQRLSHFSKQEINNNAVREPLIGADAKGTTVTGPIDAVMPSDRQHKLSLSWKTGKTSDIVETFAMGILGSLLLDGYGSPMFKALIESGIGMDFTPNTGLDTSSGSGIFSIGVVGIEAEAMPRFQEIVHETLRTFSINGFEDCKISGLLHQLELSLRHQTATFGVDLLQRLQPAWFNGVDPLAALTWNSTISSFREHLQAGPYLESLIQKYFLHKSCWTFVMKPSPDHNTELRSQEKSRLDTKLSHLHRKYSSRDALDKHLLDQERRLVEVQTNNAETDIQTLPSLRTTDISREATRQPVRRTDVRGIPVQWIVTDTNGLIYFRAFTQINGLSRYQRMLLPLFTECIMRLGTTKESIEELEDQLKLKTGGFSVSYHSSPNLSNIISSSEGLLISGQSSAQNFGAMLDLIRKMISTTDFKSSEARNQILQLLQTQSSGVLDNIAESGHMFAQKFAESGLLPRSQMLEQVGGLSQASLVTWMAQQGQGEVLNNLAQQLEAIQKVALCKDALARISMVCETGTISQTESVLEHFLADLPPSGQLAPEKHSLELRRPQTNTFLAMPFQVGYSAQCHLTVPYAHPDSASLQIAAKILSHQYLHRELREKGGAYGGAAYLDALTGCFGIYSYRDPTPFRSIDIASTVGEWLGNYKVTSSDIEEAKLTTFQAVDAPQSASDKGSLEFLYGVNDEMRQQRRERLLDVTAANIAEITYKYLVESQGKSQSTIIGGESMQPSHPAEWSSCKLDEIVQLS